MQTARSYSCVEDMTEGWYKVKYVHNRSAGLLAFVCHSLSLIISDSKDERTQRARVSSALVQQSKLSAGHGHVVQTAANYSCAVAVL